MSSCHKFLIVMTLCLLSLSSCHTGKNNVAGTSGEQTSSSINGSWSLTAFHSNDFSIDESKPSFVPTLEVNVALKKIAGRDGCNNIYASLSKIDNQEIAIGVIGGTKMGCKMKQPYDEQYRNLLRAARKYEIEESVLILLDAQSNKLLEFHKVNS